jgi:hypothetical protein
MRVRRTGIAADGGVDGAFLARSRALNQRDVGFLTGGLENIAPSAA